MRRIRTELATSERRTWSNGSARAAGQPNEFLRFSAAPELAETYDASTGELRLESLDRLSRGNDDRQEERNRQPYREFCDWYCLLNTRINPACPLARTQVNKAPERLDLRPRRST